VLAFVVIARWVRSFGFCILATMRQTKDVSRSLHTGGGRSLPSVLCVLYQPSFNYFKFKSPLVTDFKPRQFFLSQQPIDGEFVHVEIFGDLLNSEQPFQAVLIFFHFLSKFPRHQGKALHGRQTRRRLNEDVKPSAEIFGVVRRKPAGRHALCIEAITPGQWPAYINRFRASASARLMTALPRKRSK
jgi:hypothetical protein